MRFIFSENSFLPAGFSFRGLSLQIQLTFAILMHINSQFSDKKIAVEVI